MKEPMKGFGRGVRHEGSGTGSMRVSPALMLAPPGEKAKDRENELAVLFRYRAAPGAEPSGAGLLAS